MKKFLRKFFPLLSCVALLASMLIPVAAATVYTVRYDGSTIISYSSSSSSVSLTLVVTSYGFKISVDGAQEDHQYTGTENNISTRHFGGLNLDGSSDSLTYSPGNNYSITLDSSHNTLDLYSVYLYPLYIDPNGGTWNGSSSTSVFWELPNSDTDEIYDPVRDGYTFTGWSFSGSGEFNNNGDPPYNYEHGQGVGYLTATWQLNNSSSYFTSISVSPSFSVSFLGSPTSSPDVTATCSGNTVVFSSGGTSYTYTYSGSGTYSGLAMAVTPSTPLLTPGDTVNLSGADGRSVSFEFVPVLDSGSSPGEHFTTSVRVFNSLGTDLLADVSMTSLNSDLSPVITVTVTSNGFIIQPVDGGEPRVWDGANEFYTGLSLQPYSSAVYGVGSTFNVGGEPNLSSLTLYAAYDTGVADPNGVDLVSWLADAVGGFLDFEIWPGLSLNQLLWVILVIGVLFWFLKITI